MTKSTPSETFGEDYHGQAEERRLAIQKTTRPITDKREILKREIASMLDHPSVFMGGPSQGNQRRAERIIEFLEREYSFAVEPR